MSGRTASALGNLDEHLRFHICAILDPPNRHFVHANGLDRLLLRKTPAVAVESDDVHPAVIQPLFLEYT